MFRKLIAWTTGVFSVIWVTGCGSSSSAPPGVNPPDKPASGGSSAGGAPTQPPSGGAPSSLAFETNGTLVLATSERRELKVSVSPPGTYLVRFALVDTSDAPNDAALDRTQTSTTPQGVATVVLTAPSRAVNFGVRASVNNRSALLPVVVSAGGVTTLRVEPVYTGKRVAAWNASAHLAGSCESLPGTFPPDGSLVGVPGANGQLEIRNVPFGQKIAILARSGHYALGCANLSDVAGAGDTPLRVQVTDVPLELAVANLDVMFGASDSSSQLNAVFSATVNEIGNQLLTNAPDDVVALLSAMQYASGNPAQFQSIRGFGNWDANLRGRLGGTAIRNLANKWLFDGIQRLASPDAFQGRLTSLGNSAAHLAFANFGGVLPVEAQATSIASVSWSSVPGDTVSISTEFMWSDISLVVNLGRLAMNAETGFLTMPEGLADRLDCRRVAQTLVSLGEAPGRFSFGVCDELCTQRLCLEGLRLLWRNAAADNGGIGNSLVVSASGAAAVGDYANLIGLQGRWVGRFRNSNNVSLSGSLKAVDRSGGVKGGAH